ncbi:MAG: WbqC family protein [Bacteroidales bacterium]
MENNNLPIFPAFFFPNVEYFIHLSKFDKVKIEAMETYPKQSFRNRTYIQSANGKISINIPIIKESSNRQTISEVKISYNDNWNIKAFRTICSAYGKSPFFEYYEEDIKEFFFKRYEKLFDLNLDILSYFQKRFQIKTEIIISQEYLKPNTGLDFRDKFLPNPQSNNSQARPNHKPYIQCFSDKLGFIENLSSIDLLFNMGKESINYINNSSLDYQ